MPNVTDFIESHGNQTLEPTKPEITGADVTRQAEAQNAAKGNAFESIGKIVGAVSGAIEGISKGQDGAGSDLTRDQGIQAGQASVSRDANGQLQIQPHASTMFGGGNLLSGLFGGGGGSSGGGGSTGAYEHAAATGAAAAASIEVDRDINDARIKFVNDPAGFREWGKSYVPGLAGRTQGSGIAGTVTLHAQEEIGRHAINLENAKGANDIKNSQYAITSKIETDSNDAYNLAIKGGRSAPEGSPAHTAYIASHTAAVQGYQTLLENKTFGFSKEQIDHEVHGLEVKMLDADNQGQIDSTYKRSGAVAAAKESEDRINAVPHISEPERETLRTRANARIQFNSGQNAEAVNANRAALKEMQDHPSTFQSGTLDAVIKRAGETGDPETARNATAFGATRDYHPGATGLSPSQTDKVMGVPGGPTQAQLFSFLTSQGASKNTATMLTGAAISESNLDPTLTHDGGIGYGMFGHNGDRLANMRREYGTQTPTWQQQASYALKESNSLGTSARADAATDAAGITDQQMHFERPKGYTKDNPRGGDNYSGRKASVSLIMGEGGVAAPGKALVALHGGNVESAVDGAMKLIGKNEIVNRDEIHEYLRTGGHDLDPKTQAWCAAFVGAALQHSGIKGVSDIATSYLNWGVPVSGEIKKGDVLVENRGLRAGQMGGHVMLATGQVDARGRIGVIGGNQSQGVSGDWVNRGAVVARRYDPNAPLMSNVSTTASPGAATPGGFTQAEYDANPHLLSNVVHTMVQDEGLRSQSATALGTSIGRVLDHGELPPHDDVVQYYQDSNDGKHDAEREKIAAQYSAGVALRGGEGAPGGTPAVESLANEAASRGSLRGQNYAITVRDAGNKARTQMVEDTAGYAETVLKIPRAGPINYADPQAVAQGIAARGATAAKIAATEPGFSPSAVFKPDIQGLKVAASSGDPVQQMGVVTGLAAIPQGPVHDATFANPDVRGAVLASTRSPDGHVQAAAFALLDREFRANPVTFDTEWKGASKELSWYQSVEWRKTPGEILKDRMTAEDPGAIAAREQSGKVADKNLETVTTKEVAGKLVSTWQKYLGSAYVPTSDVPGQTQGALRNDYAVAYKEHFQKYNDPDAATDWATKQTAIKWGTSVANGGRVMAFPPERSPVLPVVNGSHEWIKSQADEDVHQMVLQTTQVPEEQRALQRAPYALVPDQQTEVEMHGRVPPSYRVVVQSQDGRMIVLTGSNGNAFRWSADPARAKAAAETQDNARMVQYDRAQEHPAVIGAGVGFR